MVRGAACGRHAEPWSSSGAGARGVGRGAAVGDPGQASRRGHELTGVGRRAAGPAHPFRGRPGEVSPTLRVRAVVKSGVGRALPEM